MWAHLVGRSSAPPGSKGQRRKHQLAVLPERFPLGSYRIRRNKTRSLGRISYPIFSTMGGVEQTPSDASSMERCRRGISKAHFRWKYIDDEIFPKPIVVACSLLVLLVLDRIRARNSCQCVCLYCVLPGYGTFLALFPALGFSSRWSCSSITYCCVARRGWR